MAPRAAPLAPLLPGALLLVLGALPTLAAAGRRLRPAPPADPRPAHAASLLEKGQRRWNWQSASEETKTEWSIVLKRYVMFDMTLLELEHRWEEVMPSLAVGTGADQGAPEDESLARIKAKVAKLHEHLEKAVLDQNTSDSTADDMQRDIRTNNLTKDQKRMLREEHQRERYGFFAVEASAQDVFSQATALLQAVASRGARSSGSWASILPTPTAYPKLLANATEAQPSSAGTGAAGAAGANRSAANGSAAKQPADPLAALLAKYREVVKTFRTDLGNFQNMQQKARTSLLAGL